MDQSPVFVGYCCIQLRASMKSKYPWDSNHHYDNGWKKYNHHCLPKGFNHPNWVNHYFNGGGSVVFKDVLLPLPGELLARRKLEVERN